MTMKKVIAFTLVILLALGCMVFAHAAVTAEQEQLSIYPTLEIGDPSVLNGLTVSTPLKCGSHLSWTPQHTFGGDTVTAFTYSRKPLPTAPEHLGSMDVHLSARTDGSYRQIVRPISVHTPAGTSTAQSVELGGKISQYDIDCYLEYRDGTSESDYHDTMWMISQLFESTFRFPVREGDMATIKVSRDPDGQLSEFFRPDNGLSLSSVCDMNAEGIWFLLDFYDNNGVRPYKSPMGHGIYHIPWKPDDLQPEQSDLVKIEPNVSELRLSVPLEAGPKNKALLVDPARKLIHLLTQEDGMHVLSTYDMDSGTQRARLELLPHDPDQGRYCTIYRYLGDYLLLKIQDHMVLTDAAGETLLLTAPTSNDQDINVANLDPKNFDHYFDGETLFIAGFYSSRPYRFAITAWSEGAQTYYGEYSCTLTEGNEDWYYSPVELTDLTLKGG